MTQYIIVQGNPVDGYIFIGPFENEAEAINIELDEAKGFQWVAELRDPQDEAV